jgi:hypothetical protein
MGEDREGTIVTWPARLASWVLDPDDREIVLGDIAESRTGTRRAVCDILGFAFRRQAAAWGDWQPWFGLIYVGLPLGILLGIVSRFWADDAAQTIQLYVSNWDGSLFRNPGGRQYVIELTNAALLQCAALAVWSYNCGQAFVVLSRRASGLNGIFFYGCLLVATVGTTTTARANVMNAAIFEQAMYGAVLPLLIRVLTTLLPVGIALMTRRGSQPLGWAAFWALAAAGFTLVTFRGIESSLFFGWVVRTGSAAPRDVAPMLGGQWLPGPDGFIVSADDIIGWRLRALSLFTLFPVTLMLTFAVWRRWAVDSR